MLTKKSVHILYIVKVDTYFSRDNFNIGKILIKLCIEYLEVYKMSFDELKTILRNDFMYYIRESHLKSECECCGDITDLEVHHITLFSDMLAQTLDDLKLSRDDEFTEKQIDIIKDIMLGKQVKCKYLTLCKKCHYKYHDKMERLVDKVKKRRNREVKRREEAEKKKIKKFIKEYLNYPLDKEIQLELIELCNLRSGGHLKKGISSISAYLEEKFEVRVISCRMKVCGKLQTYWKIVKMEEVVD